MSEDTVHSPLSIVVPAYNEERRLGASLRRMAEYFASCGLTPEIVLVDDGSRDGTAAVGREFLSLYEGPGLLLINHRNRGKGYSVRRGVMAAAGERVLITDADLSTPIEEVHALLERQEHEGWPIVIGSRALPGSRIEVRQPRLREALGKCFNRLVRALTGLQFADTQCGFKLLLREPALPAIRDMMVDGFAFDVELIWRAQRAGLGVVECPIKWRDSRGSSVSLLTDAPRMLWDLLRLRRRLGRVPAPAGGRQPFPEAAPPGAGSPRR
jgi:dolichyl-phosphate beta-glucosyltransferase